MIFSMVLNNLGLAAVDVGSRTNSKKVDKKSLKDSQYEAAGDTQRRKRGLPQTLTTDRH